MIDIKFLRENPDIVKENIKNKFQEQKLVLVDEVIELDKKNREVKLNGDNLRSERKNLSAQIGGLMKNGQKEEAEKIKQQVQKINEELVQLEMKNARFNAKVIEDGEFSINGKSHVEFVITTNLGEEEKKLKK